MTSKIIVYDLINKHNKLISPYAWRVRALLSYKGLNYEAKGLSFHQIHTFLPEHFNSYKMVPVLVDGDKIVKDSWDIALYLEKYGKSTLPTSNTLEAYKLFALYVSPHLNATAMYMVFPTMLDQVVDEDREHMMTKLIRVGTLDQVRANFDANLKRYYVQLNFMSKNLIANRKRGASEVETYFLGGFSFADICVAGSLHWIECALGTEKTFGKNEFMLNWYKHIKEKVNLVD
jgi:glutathione S-transferase